MLCGAAWGCQHAHSCFLWHLVTWEPRPSLLLHLKLHLGRGQFQRGDEAARTIPTHPYRGCYRYSYCYCYCYCYCCPHHDCYPYPYHYLPMPSPTHDSHQIQATMLEAMDCCDPDDCAHGYCARGYCARGYCGQA